MLNSKKKSQRNTKKLRNIQNDILFTYEYTCDKALKKSQGMSTKSSTVAPCVEEQSKGPFQSSFESMSLIYFLKLVDRYSGIYYNTFNKCEIFSNKHSICHSFFSIF